MSTRKNLIRKAASLPKGSEERREILATLKMAQPSLNAAIKTYERSPEDWENLEEWNPRNLAQMIRNHRDTTLVNTVVDPKRCKRVEGCWILDAYETYRFRMSLDKRCIFRGTFSIHTNPEVYDE